MVPTEYEFQRIALMRGLILGEKFKRLEAGFEGEEKFYRYLKAFGMRHWVILRNVWFNDDSDFECDFILLTWHGIYLFEVKNYYGKFVYENGACSSRGVPITYNPVDQARNATLHLRNITRGFPGQLEVHGALVFIGEHNHVEIRDDITFIDIVQTNEVYQFMHEIKLKEEAYRGSRSQLDALAGDFRTRQIPNPYLSLPFTPAEMKKAKSGVFCANCQEKVEITRSDYVKCECGLHEPKEEAIVRSACEYGVLTHGRNFTAGDIEKFLGSQSSIKYIKKVLSTHFDIVEDSKVVTYINSSRDFPHISTNFQFKLPKKRYL